MALTFPVAPMKATLGTLPDGDGWAHEIKWDGHRTLAHVVDGEVRLQATAGGDATARWPEVRAIGTAINAGSAILDGEMLVIGEDGRPSFDLVQRRDPARHPAMFHVFDVLQVDGTDVTSADYLQRRSLLAGLLEPGSHWDVPAYRIGEGAELLAATREQGLEGLIAKRTDSTYRPGARSKDWVKVKNRIRTEVVIGGFTEGAGRRSGTLGALLVGVPDGAGLRFAGGVGTGFDLATLESLTAALTRITTDTHPFTSDPPRQVARSATWVRPERVAVIEIAEFTNDGHVRHASFVSMIER
ncbi:MAG: non-homologous end-joining DNA ligase [Ilumatobacter sp.]|uniref:non-homologous end-joining DNA ligase n=1 Tax=Ilumatobacter sp. TaxID=1967498 RepID=UPI0032977DC1